MSAVVSEVASFACPADWLVVVCPDTGSRMEDAGPSPAAAPMAASVVAWAGEAIQKMAAAQPSRLLLVVDVMMKPFSGWNGGHCAEADLGRAGAGEQSGHARVRRARRQSGPSGMA
jgi:hypothetical protein